MNRHTKTDAAHAITVLEGEDKSIYIFLADDGIRVKLIENEWKLAER